MFEHSKLGFIAGIENESGRANTNACGAAAYDTDESSTLNYREKSNKTQISIVR